MSSQQQGLENHLHHHWSHWHLPLTVLIAPPPLLQEAAPLLQTWLAAPLWRAATLPEHLPWRTGYPPADATIALAQRQHRRRRHGSEHRCQGRPLQQWFP